MITTPTPDVQTQRENMRQMKNWLADLAVCFHGLAEHLPMPYRAKAVEKAKEIEDRLHELDAWKGGE